MWLNPIKAQRTKKLYKQQPTLVSEALTKLLDTEPNLRWSLVLNAYLEEEINLGKAAELLDMHQLDLKARFNELGIPIRHGAANKAEAQAEVDALV